MKYLCLYDIQKNSLTNDDSLPKIFHWISVFSPEAAYAILFPAYETWCFLLL